MQDANWRDDKRNGLLKEGEGRKKMAKEEEIIYLATTTRQYHVLDLQLQTPSILTFWFLELLVALSDIENMLASN